MGKTSQRSFAPVAANFEYDRDRWHPGEEFRCGLWVINDKWEEIPGAEVRWRITDGGERNVIDGRFAINMAADSANKLGDVIFRFNQAGEYKLTADVRNAHGDRISENIVEFQVN